MNWIVAFMANVNPTAVKIGNANENTGDPTEAPTAILFTSSTSPFLLPNGRDTRALGPVGGILDE
jgi:hypothetical protein